MSRTREIVNAFGDSEMFTNGLHSAQLDRVFAEQTQACAFRMCGNVKHYAWPSKLSARVTTALTWTEIAESSSDLHGIPWQMTPGFAALAGVVTIYTNVRRPLCVRLRTDDLVDVTSEALGNPSALQTPAIRQEDRGLSRYASRWSTPGFESVTFNCSVVPSVPANYRVAVHVDVLAPVVQSSFYVYLGRLVLLEQPDDSLSVLVP